MGVEEGRSWNEAGFRSDCSSYIVYSMLGRTILIGGREGAAGEGVAGAGGVSSSVEETGRTSVEELLDSRSSSDIPVEAYLGAKVSSLGEGASSSEGDVEACIGAACGETGRRTEGVGTVSKLSLAGEEGAGATLLWRLKKRGSLMEGSLKTISGSEGCCCFGG